MGKLYDKLSQDVRLQEGLIACINCGTCTAVCPASEFYRYDPKKIVNIVQTQDDTQIEELLRSETIWYCGECMSCVTRCPRKNAPGLVVMALRGLAQDMGYFTDSEKGRQQLALKRVIGESIVKSGYCITPRMVSFENHPETGPMWKWVQENLEDVYARMGANLNGEGEGVLRKIPQESLDELQRIFDLTGATERFDKIEQASAAKAQQMGLTDQEYFDTIYTTNNGTHFR